MNARNLLALIFLSGLMGGCAGTGINGRVTPGDVGQTIHNADDAAKLTAEILVLAEQAARDYKEIRAVRKK